MSNVSTSVQNRTHDHNNQKYYRIHYVVPTNTDYLLVLCSCNIQSVIPTTVFFQLREMLRIMKMPAQ